MVQALFVLVHAKESGVQIIVKNLQDIDQNLVGGNVPYVILLLNQEKNYLNILKHIN